MAYGDLNSATVPEAVDDWSLERLATLRSTPILVNGATSACARGIEFWRYGIEQQQGALGTGNPQADAGV